VSQIPLRVVIAEDEALIRLDLKEMLEEEGYEVAGEAADGEKAVELASALKPDLVILDVKMPILDGISAAERIAAQQIAPVVILTAFSQRELVERARDAGAMAYLVKPFTKADLVPAIEIAVSRFQGPSLTHHSLPEGWQSRVQCQPVSAGRTRPGTAGTGRRSGRAAAG
jgi:two-component system, response regulator PdtaR